MVTPFDDVDYADWLKGSRESAATVVPLLIAQIEPGSVVDVGCGLGAWLAVFEEHGVQDILGIDGPWVDQNQLEVPAATFRSADLREPLDHARRFDLALCLEVAQLLDPAMAAPLVQTLTSFSDVVVFAAAIPGQGGLGHLNEQWPHYWAELFAAGGYVATDPFRAQIWEATEVKWWFAQNTVCFAAPAALDRFPSLGAHVCPTGSPLPLVHPGCLASLVDAAQTPPPPRRSRLPWRNLT